MMISTSDAPRQAAQHMLGGHMDVCMHKFSMSLIHANGLQSRQGSTGYPVRCTVHGSESICSRIPYEGTDLPPLSILLLILLVRYTGTL